MSELQHSKVAYSTSVEAGHATVTEKTHQWDPNLKQAKIDELHAATHDGDPEAIKQAHADFIEDSPYEEVRAAVRNIDGGEPANTVRAWVLGMLFVTVASGVNMFLSMRSPAINFPNIVVLLVVYPFGVLWARVMPKRQFNTCGIKWTLNTGPFNIKEHAVITIMAGISINYAYSTNALLALLATPFYNVKMSWGFQLLFTLSSQVIGIALAGVFRRFLVWPAAIIWPNQFSNSALLHAFHDPKSVEDEANSWKISRMRFFLIVMGGMFVYYWFPGVIWQGLQVFAFATWYVLPCLVFCSLLTIFRIKPDNVIVNQLFGGYTGLSLLPITFDWTYVSSYLQDPLLAPAHAHMNTLIGLVVFVIVTTLGISFTNTWYGDYLPINTSTTFDNTQAAYNVTNILGPNFSFDLTKYKAYSPMFLAPTLALNYGLSFAALTASIVHVILFHRKEIWYRFKEARNQEPDIHMKLMLKYAPCPDWWYGILFVISVGFGLATILAYDSQIPWWAYFVSLIIALIFIIPTCMIYGITNIMLSLNILSPFLGGYMIPGKPIGVMIFKVYSTIVLGQAQLFSADLKLAHYMKVPPRTAFMAQLVATMWASFVQVAVMNWTLGNIPDICTRFQKSNFTCPNGRAFFSSSIVWGVVGPHRMFGPGSIYSSIHYYWLIGAALPVMFFFLVRLAPKSPLRYLNAPVMLGAMGWLPPATPLSFSTWALWGLVFNYWIMRRFQGWWHKYNYITAAGLDAGLIISTIVIFFAITFKEYSIPWWGNQKPFETTDYLNTAIRKTVAEGEKFGPKTW